LGSGSSEISKSSSNGSSSRVVVSFSTISTNFTGSVEVERFGSSATVFLYGSSVVVTSTATSSDTFA